MADTEDRAPHWTAQLASAGGWIVAVVTLVVSQCDRRASDQMRVREMAQQERLKKYEVTFLERRKSYMTLVAALYDHESKVVPGRGPSGPAAEGAWREVNLAASGVRPFLDPPDRAWLDDLLTELFSKSQEIEETKPPTGNGSAADKSNYMLLLFDPPVLIEQIDKGLFARLFSPEDARVQAAAKNAQVVLTPRSTPGAMGPQVTPRH